MALVTVWRDEHGQWRWSCYCGAGGSGTADRCRELAESHKCPEAKP